MNTEEQTCLNEDKEIWRETPEDYYSPSIHITKQGKVGIDVGGLVVVMDIREWHHLGMKKHGCLCQTPSSSDNDKCPVHYPLRNQIQ